MGPDCLVVEGAPLFVGWVVFPRLLGSFNGLSESRVLRTLTIRFGLQGCSSATAGVENRRGSSLL